MPIEENELVLTKDGSLTLRSAIFKETYHSIHGAVTESKHVFIQEGLQYVFESKPTDISILEFGFGTGLNALLSCEFAEKHSAKINYHSLELYPISLSEAISMDYGQELINGTAIMQKLHDANWELSTFIENHFKLTKNKISFELYKPDIQFDIIYHDAFAPSTQEMFWLNPFIQQCYDWLLPKGILVSYCAKGSFKRALRGAGFIIEAIAGPPGKREMTRAIKP